MCTEGFFPFMKFHNLSRTEFKEEYEGQVSHNVHT